MTKLISRSRNKLIWSNLFIIVSISIEVVGGYFSNSLAIGTDVAHLIADLSAIWISIYAIDLAKRPRSKRMSFGWYRAENVGAMVSVLIIWAVTGFLVICAVFRMRSKEHEMNGLVMLITSGLGVFINCIMYKSSLTTAMATAKVMRSMDTALVRRTSIPGQHKSMLLVTSFNL